MSSFSDQLAVSSDEGSHLDVIVSSLRELRERTAPCCPSQKQWADPILNSGANGLLSNNVLDIFDSSSHAEPSNKGGSQDRLMTFDCEQNLSISTTENLDRMAKIRLRVANAKECSASTEDALSCSKNSKASGSKASLCHQAMPASFQAEALSKTLQSALSLCNNALLDPVFDNIEGRKTSVRKTADNRRGLARPVKQRSRRLQGVRSFDGIQRRFSGRRSQRWQRTTGSSGSLNPYTQARHSKPTLEESLVARSSRHSIASLLSDLSFEDDSSLGSFGSEVSSLGMASLETDFVRNDPTPTEFRRRTSKQSCCPSVDTALHGNSSANLSREDSLPKRPRRRRSQSPVARNISSSSKGKSRFMAPNKPRDLPPCPHVRQVSSTGNLALV